ncbi:MAG TPA: hypothetical protein VK427_07910 [Kofleriaceae bacterium]|nr:hypothetical protein [Kofleriaceae bacterium]
MANDTNNEPDEIGKPHATSEGARPGSERARDEQREGGGPRYGGTDWKVADERGDRRFGVARNDDSDPSELAKGMGSVDDDEWPGADASLQTGASGESEDVANRAAAEDNGEAQNGGQQAGMNRGEQPRKMQGRTDNG